MHHESSISLQLKADLSVYEKKECVLVHLVIEVVRLVGSLLKPGPWHIELVMEVVPRM